MPLLDIAASSTSSTDTIPTSCALSSPLPPSPVKKSTGKAKASSPASTRSSASKLSPVPATTNGGPLTRTVKEFNRKYDSRDPLDEITATPLPYSSPRKLAKAKKTKAKKPRRTERVKNSKYASLSEVSEESEEEEEEETVVVSNKKRVASAVSPVDSLRSSGQKLSKVMQIREQMVCATQCALKCQDVAMCMQLCECMCCKYM